jgi:hypothetical protein
MAAGARRCAATRGTSKRPRAAALIAALTCALRAHAAAVTAPELPVRVAGCADEMASALPALVSLEIDVLLRERAARAAPESIVVRCDDDAAQIDVALAGEHRASTIALGALAPEHRARAVALAAAELVDAMSRPAPVAAQPAAPAPATPAAPARPPEAVASGASSAAPRSMAARPAVLLGAIAEWIGQPKQVLFGGRLTLLYPLGPVITPALSVDATFGDFASASGQVSARAIGGAAYLYAGAAAGKLRFDAGPGVRAGWVRLRGESSSSFEGAALSAAWAGPELRARVAYAPLHASVIALDAGAGFVVLPVRGLVNGATPAYSIEGPWLSACLQAGVTW